MKKLCVMAVSMLAWLALPAMAAETTTKPVKAETVTSAYSGKKDDAYWTRIWYEKQAAKGIHYKTRVYKKSKKSSSVKRASVKKASVKRSKRISSKNSYSRRSSGGRVLARVDLSSQRMNVYQGGRLVHTWKVSTGRRGYGTPTGTWRIHRMHKRYFSRKYDNAPMPYAMFYYRGFAIHGTNSISRLGRPASHGCVRLHPSNAATLFSMVRRHGGTVKVVY